MNPADIQLAAELDAWYGNTPALHGVAFELRAGEVLGLVGGSGSGKSTLSLALLGLLGYHGGRATGRLQLAGRDLLTLTQRDWRSIRGRQLALVPQNPHGALNPALRLRAHFEEAWRAHSRQPWATRQAALLDQFATLDLPGDPAFLQRYPGQISTGQAQRVLIALALLHQPAVLIADEPTSALDPLAARETIDLFRRINQTQGVSLLYISHDLASVAGLCHRVAILRQGHLVEIGPTPEIFASPRHPYTQRLVAAIPRVPLWTPPAPDPDAAVTSLAQLQHQTQAAEPSPTPVRP